jgi:type IV pilus assembly protein PilA
MKERFLERQAELRERNDKGFTLMEMLIVVAIIAVLIAIAIPVFTTQLEKSRESADLANLRGAYAAGTTAAMTGKYAGSTTPAAGDLYYDPTKDGSLGSTGQKLGQGTATNGGSNIDVIKGWSSYSCTDDVRDKVIKVTFKDGMLSGVNFA